MKAAMKTTTMTVSKAMKMTMQKVEAPEVAKFSNR